MSVMGKGSDSADRSVTWRDRVVCALVGHDEDFGLFEREGEIKTCSNCQRAFRWTASGGWVVVIENLGRPVPTVLAPRTANDSEVTSLLLEARRHYDRFIVESPATGRVELLFRPPGTAKKKVLLRALLWIAAVVVIGIVVLLFTSCASTGDVIPKTNCSSVAYVQFTMPGTVQDCGSGASILKYGGRSYPMTCGSVVSVMFDGKSFKVDGQSMTIAPDTKCDKFGGLLVTIARRAA